MNRLQRIEAQIAALEAQSQKFDRLANEVRAEVNATAKQVEKLEYRIDQDAETLRRWNDAD